MRQLRVVVFGWLISLVFCVAAGAQSPRDVVWVQIEAHQTLREAQERAQVYASQIEDVNGFVIGRGWYGIALGPYRRADADQVLRVYRREGLIPRDSYIAFSRNYQQQFWPVGANILNRGVIATPPADVGPSQSAPVDSSETTQAPVAPPADETPAQARRSEQLLSRAERQDLQTALKWAGFYNAAIDGAFGRGTRASMAAWQDANNFEATGILTTAQRSELFKQYNSVLEGMDLQLVRDTTAGIEMQIPTGVVAFEKYEYPFAQYSATGEIPAQVLLISQDGDQNTLFGLYDIMQTLEIVPLDGARDRKSSSFQLVGQNDKIISYTEVGLIRGQIKGFTLVWPAGDEDRRTRVLDIMRDSFTRTEGVIDPSWSDAADQSIDLVAGLQIRAPRLSRSGFFVSNDGAVVTTYEAVQNCSRITLDGETDAQLGAVDDELGVAILRPDDPIAPRALARFSTQAPRLQSDVAVSGFSYGGVLGAPTMSFGTLSDLRGLSGESTLTRLSVETLDGDAGGPVFDAAGGVLGMLLPRVGAAARQLPKDVNFAADTDVIQSLLAQANITAQTSESRAPMAPEDITVQARDMTVLVSCWD